MALPARRRAPEPAGREYPRIRTLEVKAYTVPTDGPESDGTFAWDATTIVVVHAEGGGKRGLGYSYTEAAAGRIVNDLLADRVVGRNALDVPACWVSMTSAIRNIGEQGLGRMAAAAVDAALWDLKARLLDIPLVELLGAVREDVPVYGSGGFTSYTPERLLRQLVGWVDDGIPRVKMKVGRDPGADPDRVRAAREAIGDRPELFVDANGAYARKQALALAEEFSRHGVSWFEEPVVYRDLEGLRLLRDRAPAGMDISVGEYGFEPSDFRDIIAAGAADVLQADATRCGITGFVHAAALCEAHNLPLSSHCAPSIHLHPCCALWPVRHMEYFHDHVRIERMLFDGFREPEGGRMRPDLGRPGMGLTLKARDARKYERQVMPGRTPGRPS